MNWSTWLRPYRSPLIAAGVLVTLEAPLPGLAVLLLARALEGVIAADASAVWPAASGLVALTAAGIALRIVRTRLSKTVAWRLAEALRLALMGRWMWGPLQPVGDRISALTDEVDQVQYGVSAIVTAWREPITLAVLVGLAAREAPMLVPWAVLVVLPVGLAAWASGRFVRSAATRSRQARASLVERMAELLLGVEVVEGFGAAERELRAVADLAKADREARVRLEVVRLLPSAMAELAAMGAIALLLVVGSRAVAQGALGPSNLLAFAVALGLARRPLSGLSEAWSLWTRASAALARVDAVLAEGPRAMLAGVGQGARVAITDACLIAGDAVVVGPICLEVAPGEMVALVGATGSGKSTVLRWVAGLAAPDGGAVRVGAEVPHLQDPGSRQTAWVPQDGFLFARSVADNLRLGAPGRALDALRADQSEAHVQDIDLDRVLGPAGAPLSGGERQRLALARALASERPLLVLDEPTSQVDPVTEQLLVETLTRLKGRRTILLATHDPRLAAAADRVVHLAEGQVVAATPLAAR